ncbi:hypothetical protein RND81_12G071400 [Saponaria officinalis]|uniref:Aquaporin NIP7-1 n=1 Tax=Saponaria officinalis TaxID=3572 RepID=A0AAW1H7L3_SAPOF
MLEEATTSSLFHNNSLNEKSTKGQSSNNLLIMGTLHDSMNGDQCVNRRSTLWWLLSKVKLHDVRIVIAEVIGTFILIFSVFGIMGSMRLLGTQVGLTEYAITAGSSITLIGFTLGSISGAHVNPAVTFAFAVFGHFPWPKVPFYVSAQMLGSIVATYSGELVFGVKPELVMTVPVKGGVFAAFFAELIATFMVTFLAATLAKDAKSVGHLAPFAMGITIILAVLITGPVSGGSLNPARSLGPAILTWRFSYIWIYIFAPTAGAILGVLMVHALCTKQSDQSPSLSTTTSNSIT